MLKQLLLIVIWVMAANHFLLAQPDKDLLLDTLSQQIAKLHEEKIKEIPKEIRRKITECASLDDMKNLDLESQYWLHENFTNCGGDLEIGKNFVKLKDNGNGWLDGPDVTSILRESFWCRLKGKPFDLKKCFELREIASLELENPEIEFAPEGKGKIDWIWKLNVESRPNGIIHVGIDTKTRRFLCYERTVGVYYPEGETLERLYAEIVQDPLLAGTYIGKGRIEKIKEENKNAPK